MAFFKEAQLWFRTSAFHNGKSASVVENINQNCSERGVAISPGFFQQPECFSCCGRAERNPMETLGFLSFFVPTSLLSPTRTAKSLP